MITEAKKPTNRDGFRNSSYLEQRELLRTVCIHDYRIGMLQSHGISLSDLQETCANDCGHHQCKNESLTDYLEKHHFRR